MDGTRSKFGGTTRHNRRSSATAAEGPQQLDDLLRVPPPLPGPGAEPQPVQLLADFWVGQPTVPKLDRFGDDLGVDAP